MVASVGAPGESDEEQCGVERQGKGEDHGGREVARGGFDQGEGDAGKQQQAEGLERETDGSRRARDEAGLRGERRERGREQEGKQAAAQEFAV